jgi:hypothetical protein
MYGPVCILRKTNNLQRKRGTRERCVRGRVCVVWVVVEEEKPWLSDWEAKKGFWFFASESALALSNLQGHHISQQYRSHRWINLHVIVQP